MKGRNTLHNQPFRYGGFMKNYDREIHEIVGHDMRCWCCGGVMRSSNPRTHRIKPYTAVFRITKGKDKGMNRFRVLCRSCAYDYGKGVIEVDGKIYFDKKDFNEKKYFEEKGGKDAESV